MSDESYTMMINLRSGIFTSSAYSLTKLSPEYNRKESIDERWQ